MMRTKIFCGICKGTKYYSINRGITKVSSIIVCENCRHFYQKLKRSPFTLDCISPIKGSCFKNCSFMKTRCKGCWAMQVLDSCPHSVKLYSDLSGWLSEQCKNQMRGKPLTLGEIGEDCRGTVSLEVLENDVWIAAPSSGEEISKLKINNEDEDAVLKKEEENKRNTRDREKRRSSLRNETNSLSVAELTLEADDDIDVEEEEGLIDDPIPMEVGNNEDKTENTSNLSLRSKTSERIKRKRKKVEYFSKSTAGRKNKGPIYGIDGKINKTGIDLCDCLQGDCVGCHFPCPKCRSPKCGNECRVNRRWYYEKVEVEGTKMFWLNRFVPKI